MGFRGVDVENEDKHDDAPEQSWWNPEWSWRNYVSRRYYIRWWQYVSWRRFAILLVYIATLVGGGTFLSRSVSVEAGAGLVVAGLVVLSVIAFRSRNRGADSGLDASGGAYPGGGDWGGGDGGDGGGGGDG